MWLVTDVWHALVTVDLYQSLLWKPLCRYGFHIIWAMFFDRLEPNIRHGSGQSSLTPGPWPGAGPWRGPDWDTKRDLPLPPMRTHPHSAWLCLRTCSDMPARVLRCHLHMHMGVCRPARACAAICSCTLALACMRKWWCMLMRARVHLRTCANGGAVQVRARPCKSVLEKVGERWFRIAETKDLLRIYD